jgi:hypothetical protein
MLFTFTMKMNNSIGLLNLTSTVNRKFLLGIIVESALFAIMVTVFRLMEVECVPDNLQAARFAL